MAKFHLSTRAVLRARGEDARKLLNDTLTCRFDEALDGRGRWFALLSPQGKVQVEGLVTEVDGSFCFDLHRDLVPDFIKRMKLYQLRAKVEIEEMPALAVLWSPDGDAPPGRVIAAYADGRAAGMGTRHIVSADDVDSDHEADTNPLAAYNKARIAAGIAEFGTDFSVNEVFPHDIGMDLLDGVDFKKGCYIGQEVVSRMQHRGTARRRPVIVDGLPDGTATGAPLLVGDREAGNVGEAANGQAVAIVRLDRVDANVPPTVGGLPVKLILPAWATYRLGETIAAD